MKRIAALVCATVIGLAVPTGANADVVFAGTCTLTVTLRFSGTLSMGTTNRSLSSFEADGSCVTDSAIPVGINAWSPEGDGTAFFGNCGLVVAEGSAAGGFSGPFAPPGFAGDWTFAGDAFGGVLTFVSLGTPIFVGLGPAVGVNTGCLPLQTPTSSLSYLATVAIADP